MSIGTAHAFDTAEILELVRRHRLASEGERLANNAIGRRGAMAERIELETKISRARRAIPGNDVFAPAAAPAREMDHPTMPLPDRQGQRVEYNNGSGYMMKVERRGAGYYGDNGDCDFEAPDAATTRAKLTRWGYTERTN